MPLNKKLDIVLSNTFNDIFLEIYEQKKKKIYNEIVQKLLENKMLVEVRNSRNKYLDCNPR